MKPELTLPCTGTYSVRRSGLSAAAVSEVIDFHEQLIDAQWRTASLYQCISVSAGLNDNRTVESSDQQNGPQRNHLITAPNPGTNGVARIIVKSFPTSEPKGLIELRRSPFLALNFHYIDPLIATLKPQSNGPSYSNTVIGTLVVDWWAVTFGIRGGDWAGPQPAQAPPCCTKCNSPPINGQCTHFVLFDVPHCLWSLNG